MGLGARDGSLSELQQGIRKRRSGRPLSSLPGQVFGGRFGGNIPGAPPEPSRPPKIARNMPVRCPCGREFFVPASFRGPVRCPLCRNVVLVTGLSRPTGEPMPPPSPAGPATVNILPWLIGAGGVLLGVLILLLILLLSGGGSELPAGLGPAPVARPPAPPQSTGIPAAPAPAAPPAPAPKETPAPPGVHLPGAGTPPDRPIFTQKDLDRLVSRANLTGLVATLMIHQGRLAEFKDLQTKLEQYDKRIMEMIAQTNPPLQPPKSWFQPGDRLTWFSGFGLDPRNPKPFADNLAAWIRTFQVGAQAQGEVQRGPSVVPILFYCPERFEDLVGPVAGTGTPGAAAPLGIETSPLSADLLAEVRERMDALPEFYRRSFPPGDGERVRAILQAGAGTEEDARYLKERILGQILREFADEYAGFSAKFREAEAKALDPVSSDVIVFKDGRRIEGTIEEEADGQVRIRSRNVGLRCSRDEILRVEQNQGTVREFRARFEAAKGRPKALEELIDWCRERRLSAGKELCCYALLLLDPGHGRARSEVGLSPVPGSAAGGEARIRDGLIEWEGARYTREEFAQRLASRGHVQINGLWHEKVPGTYRIDNLYSDEQKLILYPAGASVTTLTEEVTEQVYDVNTRRFVKRAKTVAVLRHIGVTGLRANPPIPGDVLSSFEGTCHIEIRVPGPLLDCRIKAVSRVLYNGGYVSVAVVSGIGGPDLKNLYTLNAPGQNDSTFDITREVRGRSGFFLRVMVRNSGMFLPGDPHAHGLLEVRYTYGKPLERINSLLGLGGGDVPPPPSVAPGREPPEETAARVSAEVLARHRLPLEMLSEARRLTGDLRYDGVLPPVPSKYAAIHIYFTDPLKMRFEELTPEAIQQIQKCWEGLTEADRRDYLSYYILWCGRFRRLRDAGQ